MNTHIINFVNNHITNSAGLAFCIATTLCILSCIPCMDPTQPNMLYPLNIVSQVIKCVSGFSNHAFDIFVRFPCAFLSLVLI